MSPASIHFSARSGSLASLSLLLCACGGGGGGGNEQPQAARAVSQSNLEIAQMLYTGTARTPAGFYSEPAPVSGYTATFHIKTSDLAPATPADPIFELCTDDWNVALDWSESVALSEPVYSDLTATDTTEQFYQFARTPRIANPGAEQMRVYRCSFLDRAGADIARIAGAAGHINKRPVAATDLKWTLEYLWRFSPYNNVDNAVLNSSSVGDSAAPAHELTMAQLSRAAGGHACDRVRVFAWRYRADVTSGQLTSELRELWAYDARNDAGAVQVCGS